MDFSSSLIVSVVSIFLAAPDGPSSGSPAGPPSPKAPKGEGIAVEFPSRKLSESDRTPEGELKAILGATATLKTERAIRYRSIVLPPGSYPIAIEREEERSGGRNLFFVIGPISPSQEAGKGLAPAKPEDKKPEKLEGKEGAGGNAKASEGGSGRQAAKAPAGQIRALFHLLSAQKSSEAIEFSAKSNRRGDRLTLMVKAGSSQGKATLRIEN